MFNFLQASTKATKLRTRREKSKSSAISYSLDSGFGDCNSYPVEKKNEGYHPCLYYNKKNIPMIGVGYNLQNKNATKQVEQIGVKIQDLLDNKTCLDDGQIQQLFQLVCKHEVTNSSFCKFLNFMNVL